MFFLKTENTFFTFFYSCAQRFITSMYDAFTLPWLLILSRKESRTRIPAGCHHAAMDPYRSTKIKS